MTKRYVNREGSRAHHSTLGLRGQVDQVSWSETGFSYARESRLSDEFPYIKGVSFWHNGIGVNSVGERISEWLKDKKIYGEVLSSDFIEIGVGTAGSTSVVLLAARKRGPLLPSLHCILAYKRDRMWQWSH